MKDALFAIDGKVALVTGGTSGLGLMAARGLVRRGVRTYIAGRDPQVCGDIAAQLAREGGECHALAAELGTAAGPHQLASQFSARESTLHVLVNNAGANERGTLETARVEDWDQVLNVNLRAAFFLVQQLLPALRRAALAHDPARVINIGSIGGLHVPDWEAHPYGASKAALHHLTRSLAKRLGREHITVNAIAPGPFPSRLTDTSAPALQQRIATQVPMGRAGEPQDLEGLLVFLASRAGAYVSGSTIALDGGYTAAL